jgi:hypothetical protein
MPTVESVGVCQVLGIESGRDTSEQKKGPPEGGPVNF